MPRYSKTDPAPESAEIYGAFKVHRWEDGGKYYAKAWRGRAQKPFAFYVWPKADAREDWIDQQKRAEDERAQMKREHKAEREKRTAEMVATIDAGTILHCSWGYDQTNCDFYEVIEKKGKTVTLRPIGSVDVGPCSGMSTTLKPDPGHYTGDAFKKRIMYLGVRFTHGVARPIDPDRSHYSSWYA